MSPVDPANRVRNAIWFYWGWKEYGAEKGDPDLVRAIDPEGFERIMRLAAGRISDRGLYAMYNVGAVAVRAFRERYGYGEPISARPAMRPDDV